MARYEIEYVSKYDSSHHARALDADSDECAIMEGMDISELTAKEGTVVEVREVTTKIVKRITVK